MEMPLPEWQNRYLLKGVSMKILRMSALRLFAAVFLMGACTQSAVVEDSEHSPAAAVEGSEHNPAASNVGAYSQQPVDKDENMPGLDDFIAELRNADNLELEMWEFPYHVRSVMPISSEYLKENNQGFKRITNREKVLPILYALVTELKAIAYQENNSKYFELLETRVLLEFCDKERGKCLHVYISSGLAKNAPTLIQVETRHGDNSVMYPGKHAENLNTLLKAIRKL